jgi:hypothetical protein
MRFLARAGKLAFYVIIAAHWFGCSWYFIGKVGFYDAFGLIGTALPKKFRVFQSSSLKVVPISPNAS